MAKPVYFPLKCEMVFQFVILFLPSYCPTFFPVYLCWFHEGLVWITTCFKGFLCMSVFLFFAFCLRLNILCPEHFLLGRRERKQLNLFDIKWFLPILSHHISVIFFFNRVMFKDMFYEITVTSKHPADFHVNISEKKTIPSPHPLYTVSCEWDRIRKC